MAGKFSKWLKIVKPCLLLIKGKYTLRKGVQYAFCTSFHCNFIECSLVILLNCFLKIKFYDISRITGQNLIQAVPHVYGGLFGSNILEPL